MANPTATVSDFCGMLTRSRLLTADQVLALFENWKESTGGTDQDVDSFRKYLVQQVQLTDYQAALVHRGYADGFFIGGYKILDRIGKGQTAGVYKALHPSGQVVAIKVLPSSKAKNPHLLARFEREGRLLTQLNHPNVVRAFQVGGPRDGMSGPHFIAMEHLEGETLDEVLTRRKKLAPPEAVRLIYQAFQGLEHLRQSRMVHRDLKPANLFVTPAVPETTLHSTLKVLDIGLGREMFDESSGSTQDLNLTAEGSILGTPDYLAPEQARDARGADVRSDIYSLGCVLFHLIAGRPPFMEKNVMAVMVKHASEAPPQLASFAPSVAPGLQFVMNKLLAKDPAARYQTPGEAYEALRPFLPINAMGATESSVVPAYQAWLANEESTLDIPNEISESAQKQTAARKAETGAVRIGSSPVSPPGLSRPTPTVSLGPSAKSSKPSISGPASGKIPRPAALSGPASGKIPRPAAMSGPASAKIPRPAALSGPASGKIPRPTSTVTGPISVKVKRPSGMGVQAQAPAPVQAPPPSQSQVPTPRHNGNPQRIMGPPSGKIKLGSGLTGRGPSGGSGVVATPTLKPPSVPGRPSPLPAVGMTDEVDVELIVLPGVRAPESVDVLERVLTAPPPRPLWDLDRRDFVMLGIGAGATLAAIVLGLIFAKANTGRLRGGHEEIRANQPGSDV